jgi:hypothetical protein
MIDDINEGTPNARKIQAVYPYVRNEVLQVRDWRFAKIRAALTQSATAPLYAYKYAYELPADFLRLVKPHNTTSRGRNPVAIPSGYWYDVVDPSGSGRYMNYDPPVYPGGFPYVIEALPDDGTPVMLTDYDNTANDLIINYIRLVTDESLYPPVFTICLTRRLAQELAVAITENLQKSQQMANEYLKYLYSAEAVNQSMDFLEDEAGSTSWIDAGR